MFGLFAAISLTVPFYAAVCVSGSADSLQKDPHYKEVSEIAEGLSECMPNEAQKKYVYSVTMTSVFGKRYHSGWSSNYMDGDLIVELSMAESEQIPSALADLYFMAGWLIYEKSGGHDERPSAYQWWKAYTDILLFYFVGEEREWKRSVGN